MATILPTLNKARQESFGVALETIEKYLQDQVELATLGPTAQGSSYVEDIGEAYKSCRSETSYCTAVVPDGSDDGSNASNILDITEYSSNISDFRWYVNAAGKVKIICANVNPSGDYEQTTDAGLPTTACSAAAASSSAS